MATDNTLDKAGAILAARGIINELDTMIKKLGKLNTDHILRVSTGVSSLFGADNGKDFIHMSSAAINSAITAVQSSKQQISEELEKLQNIMDGVTDVSTDSGVTPQATKETPKAVTPVATDNDMDDVFDDAVGSVSAKTAMGKKQIKDDNALSAANQPKKQANESKKTINSTAFTIMEASIKKKLNETIESTVMSIIGPIIASGAQSMNLDDLAKKVNDAIPGIFVDRLLLMKLVNPDKADGAITQISGDSVYFGKTTEPLQKTAKSKAEKDAKASFSAASKEALDSLVDSQAPVYSKYSATDAAGLNRSFGK